MVEGSIPRPFSSARSAGFSLSGSMGRTLIFAPAWRNSSRRSSTFFTSGRTRCGSRSRGENTASTVISPSAACCANRRLSGASPFNFSEVASHRSCLGIRTDRAITTAVDPRAVQLRPRRAWTSPGLRKGRVRPSNRACAKRRRGRDDTQTTLQRSREDEVNSGNGSDSAPPTRAYTRRSLEAKRSSSTSSIRLWAKRSSRRDPSAKGLEEAQARTRPRQGSW